MKKNLFGNDIEPKCNYCNNFDKQFGAFRCKKNKEIKNGKCRKFDYNPLLRIPHTEPEMMKFSKEDFEI